MSLLNKKPVLSQIGLIALALFLFNVGGCFHADSDGSSVDQPPDVNPFDALTVSHRLMVMESCDQLESYTKAAAIERMRQELELARDMAVRDLMYWSTETTDRGGDVQMDMDDSANSEGADGDAAPEAGEYTETNTQEQGVDEADIVKTDGNYLYVLSQGNLIIVEVLDSGGLQEVGSMALGGYPREMFLYGDYVVTFSSPDSSEVPESIKIKYPDYDEPYYGGGPERAPETDVEVAPDYDGPRYLWEYTLISIIDVSERSDPTLTRSTVYAGTYNTSRRIDGTVRAVLASSIPKLQLPTWVDYWEAWDMPKEHAIAYISSLFDKLIVSNTQKIEALAFNDIFPKKIDTTPGGAGTAELIAGCKNTYGPFTHAGIGYTGIVTIDLEKPEQAQVDVGVVSSTGIVYASKSSLYLTTARDYVMAAWESGRWKEESTGIHKFDIKSDFSKAIYRATGKAQGHTLNQFCLGEHDDYLRIATTTGKTWEPATLDNHITVLDEVAGELKVVGHLDNIGQGEEIYAARFMGDRGFMVTFFQTDPLFTFDLSNPENPKVVGEWLGPGYSTYLHPYGEDMLMAIGRTENWETHLSLYDLTDFRAPSLVDRDTMGYDWNTPAEYDHKAFTFVPSIDKLALPFNTWENEYSTGIAVFNVSESGFEHAADLMMGSSNYDESTAERCVLIDGILYGISRCRVTSASMDNPGQTLATIPLFEGENCYEDTYYY